MTQLHRSNRPSGSGKRRNHACVSLVILFVLVTFSSNQEYSPKLMIEDVFSLSSSIEKVKHQSGGTMDNGQHTPVYSQTTDDPSSLPFHKDYLPTRIKEKWRNRHSTGVRMGAHKLKEVPKEIYSEIEQQKADTSISGPTVVHYHAIVVPYRGREYHLQAFQKRLYPYIEKHFRHQEQRKRHVSEFSLWIIEQDDDEPFNCGWLENVGIAEVLRHTPEVECLTFNDVDFAPEDADENQAVKGPVYYDKCSVPTHTGSELFRTGLNWTVGYQEYAGGVVTMHLRHWEAINGFSNDYVGWGAEDDDLYLRLRDKGLLPVSKQMKSLMRRPPPGFGLFRTVSDAKKHHIQDSDKGKSANYRVSLQILEQVRDGASRVHRSDYDGLSDLQYKVNSHKVRHSSSSPTFGFQQAHYLKVKQQLLELVPIPGTGTEWMETAASRLGIPWGRCHFQHDDDQVDADFDYFRKNNSTLGKRQDVAKSQCLANPDFAKLGLTTQHGDRAIRLWHIPPHLWNINMLLGKHTFAVVRNPFDLVIARYLAQMTTVDADDPKASEDKLNEFVTSKLCNSSDPFKTEEELIWGLSQYEYVYFNGTQRVKHVLKYENLASELPPLLEQYDLPLELPTTIDNGGEGVLSLSVDNLTNRSIALIQHHYAHDFSAFGYSKLLQNRGASVGHANPCTQERLDEVSIAH